jgi:hypothetical protein
MQSVGHGCWVTVTATIVGVSASDRWHILTTVPRRFTAGFILPRAEPSSSEYVQPAICPPSRASKPARDRSHERALHPLRQAPLGGFRVPSSRHQLVVSTCCERHPASRYVPSSAFLPPSTACSTTCLAGLFHPAATSRVFPSGIWPHRRAVPGHPRPLPSCRFLRRACLSEDGSSASAPAPGLCSPR